MSENDLEAALISANWADDALGLDDGQCHFEAPSKSSMAAFHQRLSRPSEHRDPGEEPVVRVLKRFNGSPLLGSATLRPPSIVSPS